MKRFLLLCVIAFAGCVDSEENASTNLRKGDAFLARGEYEIAQYYYDRIPEESVLFKSVQRRKKEIEKEVIAAGGGVAPGEQRPEGVFIIKHTHILQLGKMPIHTLTVLNNTGKRLNMMEVEFVYLDDGGKEVLRTPYMVTMNIGPGEEKEIGKVAPGTVMQKFSRVKVDVKRTVLF